MTIIMVNRPLQGQQTRSTQLFVLSESINEQYAGIGCVLLCIYGWRLLVKTMEVTAGMAESNSSLLPGGWLKLTCGLTAYTPGSATGPPLGNEYGRTLLF